MKQDAVLDKNQLPLAIHNYVVEQAVWPDLHSHLFPPEFAENGAGENARLLVSIDDLLRYHYQYREFRTACPHLLRRYGAVGPEEQAEMIWEEMFVKREPISVAAHGILEVLQEFGLKPNETSLASYREALKGFSQKKLVDRIFKAAGISHTIMTNDIFVADEMAMYQQDLKWDKRFLSSLRLDKLVLDYGEAIKILESYGLNGLDDSSGSFGRIREYLADWCEKWDALYIAVSLPPRFVENGQATSPEQMMQKRVLEQIVIPLAKDLKLPVFLMPEVDRQINPNAGLAGDGVGKDNMVYIKQLAAGNPEIDFWVTPLNAGSQYDVAANACPLDNLIPWGIWWFNLQPVLIEQITQMRIEMLGQNFVPYHSDARHLFHLLPKFNMFRPIFDRILRRQVEKAASFGRTFTRQSVQDLVDGFFDISLLKRRNQS